MGSMGSVDNDDPNSQGGGIGKARRKKSQKRISTASQKTLTSAPSKLKKSASLTEMTGGDDFKRLSQSKDGGVQGGQGVTRPPRGLNEYVQAGSMMGFSVDEIKKKEREKYEEEEEKKLQGMGVRDKIRQLQRSKSSKK